MQRQMSIPFNRAFIAGRELYYIAQAVTAGEIKGDGKFSQLCHSWFESRFGVKRALLTHSGTAALELAALLLNFEKDDEVILPSFTFSSTANAFVLRGGKPVFVDIRPDTLNMDEKLIEAAITNRTKAICVMHYAGVACEMDAIMEIAERHRIPVVEDAAHAIMASYRGRYLGSIGDIGAFSFHETKNFSSGEGGAVLLNQSKYIDRAEIIREKGTNRSQFFRGMVDKYTWVDVGSSFLPSEVLAAFLYAQIERADEITAERLSIWDHYQRELSVLEQRGQLRLPVIPKHCSHNAHNFYLLSENEAESKRLQDHLASKGIAAVSHYVPLHSAPMGRTFGYSDGMLPVTERLAPSLLRLPLFCGLTMEQQGLVSNSVLEYFDERSQRRFANS